MELSKASKNEYSLIKQLYLSAFPSCERAPFFFLKRRALQNKAIMYSARENGEFIGFAYIIESDELAYLFYFAVTEDKRKSGNGSKILSLLKEIYKHKRLFLSIEPLDETAENYSFRVRRHAFYIRNGFIDLPHKVREINCVFDLMSTSEALCASEYYSLMLNWAGKHMLRFVKIEFFDYT